MIINTGQRTDIPAFYAKWFINRIKEGYVLVRNPYRKDWVSRYDLNPDVVDCIAFCTKNPAPMLPYMDILKPFGQFWFVTITPYGKEIEPNVPSKEKVMEDFITLSKTLGKNSVGWRYDPIFITQKYSIERHIADFENMAKKLSGYTKVCVISFIDLYEKVKRNFPEARNVSASERAQIGETFAEIGQKYGITIKGCAEGKDLAEFGVDCSGCQTVETFENALNCNLCVPKNKKSPRAECNCLLGSDIGAYDTCGHLCRYCYANTNKENVIRNMKIHNPDSPLLLGELAPNEEIHTVFQESWVDNQLRL